MGREEIDRTAYPVRIPATPLSSPERVLVVGISPDQFATLGEYERATPREDRVASDKPVPGREEREVTRVVADERTVGRGDRDQRGTDPGGGKA